MRTGRVVDNRTLLATACIPDDLPDGTEVAVIVMKATVEVADDGAHRLPLVPAPVRRFGVRRRDEGPSSCRYPSDLAPVKVGTDILLVGTAIPPPPPVIRMPVSLRISRGDRLLVDKTVQVFGPRVWETRLFGAAPSEPQPLEATELSWENTFGGCLEEGGPLVYEPRNPVGRGLVRDPKERIGQLVPPIEDARHPLTDKQPAPAGFGAIEPSWEPRASRMGTLDEAWRRERSPLLPVDFDPRFFSLAPDDQWLAEPLQGGENVEILGVRAGRPWRFRLPRMRPVVTGRLLGRALLREPTLDTVIIDADEGRVELCWRTAFPLPRKAEKLERVEVAYGEAPPEENLDDLARRRREASSPQPLERRRA